MGHASAYRMFNTTVGSVTDVTSRMRRITLHGEDLGSFESDRPGQWVKLFFDDSGAGRAFTIRQFLPGKQEMTIDFVRHGHGLAGSWACQAKPGLPVRLAGPRSTFRHQPGRELVLLGDETAIPAISSIIEALPADAKAIAIIEATDPTATQEVASSAKVEWRWIYNENAAPGDALRRVHSSIEATPEASQLWIGCEAGTARDLRCAFTRRGFDRNSLHASGYWKAGAAEHVDAESDY